MRFFNSRAFFVFRIQELLYTKVRIRIITTNYALSDHLCESPYFEVSHVLWFPNFHKRFVTQSFGFPDLY